MTAPRRVIILDRDGTVIVDHGYLDDPEKLQFLPGAAQGLQRLHVQGHRLIIVSNQSGVGRGRLSLERLQQINRRLIDMVRAIGVELAGIYCCPHRPEENCGCRKPQTGLVLQAAAALGFEPEGCIVIGDKHSDMELGRRLGAITMLVSSGAASAPAGANYLIRDLLEASQVIDSLGIAGRDARCATAP